LKWLVTEKYPDYLAGRHFFVLTDNNPLTHVFSTAKLDTTGQRWVSALSHFNFGISYIAGIRNSDADGMSRYPYEKVDTTDCEVIKFDNSTVKAICSVMQTAYCFASPGALHDLVEVFDHQGQVIAQKDLTAIRTMQRQDPTIDI